MSLLFLNPVLLSVILLCVLCLFRFNVLLSILISALCAGLLSDISLLKTMDILINGMQGNLKTALSYILLGAIAAAISRTNLTAILINKLAKIISHKKFTLILCLALLSCFSQNLVPIHVAFIPILIPPLIGLFNKLHIDRRAVACAITFGLTAPYMVLPLGFGLIFQGIIEEALIKNGVNVSLNEVSASMAYVAICMVVGLALSMIFYLIKPRTYKQIQLKEADFNELKMNRREWGVLLGLILTLTLQIFTSNLPLSGLLGFIAMVFCGGVRYKKVDLVFDEGLKLMGYIAFVMLVASGFAEVLKESGGIYTLINATLPLMSENKLFTIFTMLCIGLIITMGIGTSFGTIPIIATLFCPLCLQLGFSVASIILIIGIAGALGDAGSPASETTLVTSAGLNADSQHNHIKDTCIPTFIFYNVPLLLIGSLLVVLM